MWQAVWYKKVECHSIGVTVVAIKLYENELGFNNFSKTRQQLLLQPMNHCRSRRLLYSLCIKRKRINCYNTC
jgi:hypothetical protein